MKTELIIIILALQLVVITASFGGSFLFTDSQINQIDGKYKAAKETIKLNPYDNEPFQDLYRYIFYAITDQPDTDEEAPKDGVDKSVWLWVRGARGVNANNGQFFSQFIRNYTRVQYTSRYGPISDIEFANLIQEASNRISLAFSEDVAGNENQLPTIEEIGRHDAGFTASVVFKKGAFPANYSPWAGTILFPYLGYGHFTEDWLFHASSDEFKSVAGTYELFSTAKASRDATEIWEAIKNTGELFATAARNRIGFLQTENLLTNLRRSANTFFSNYYSVSAEGSFDIGGDLPIHLSPSGINFLNRPSHIVGTLYDDTNIITNNDNSSFLYPGVDLVHAGLGNDTIAGSLGSDLVDGGEGIDTINYSSVDAKGLDVLLEDISGTTYKKRFVISDRHPVCQFSDLVYGVETLELTEHKDLIVQNEVIGVTFNALGGNDEITYKNAAERVNVSQINEATFEVSSNGKNEKDTLLNIEDITLTPQDDALTISSSLEGINRRFDGGTHSGFGGDALTIAGHVIYDNRGSGPVKIFSDIIGSGDVFENFETFHASSGIVLLDEYSDYIFRPLDLLGDSQRYTRKHLPISYRSAGESADFHFEYSSRLDFRSFIRAGQMFCTTQFSNGKSHGGLLYQFRFDADTNHIIEPLSRYAFAEVWGTNNGDTVFFEDLFGLSNFSNVIFHSGAGDDLFELSPGLHRSLVIEYGGGNDQIKIRTDSNESGDLGYLRLPEPIVLDDVTISEVSGERMILTIENDAYSRINGKITMNTGVGVISLVSGGSIGSDGNKSGQTNNGAGVQLSVEDDRYNGTERFETVYGDEGDDEIYSGAGDDKLYGGLGNDILVSEIGTNELYGQEGDDHYIIRASALRTIITDASGQNTVELDYGISELTFSRSDVEPLIMTRDSDKAEILSIKDGANFLNVHFANDNQSYTISEVLALRKEIVPTTENDDVIYSMDYASLFPDTDFYADLRGGNDEFYANQRWGYQYSIDGGDGDDYIEGGYDDDILSGGNGNDILVSSVGVDHLLGGLGDDTYRISMRSQPQVTITDEGGSNIIEIVDRDGWYFSSKLSEGVLIYTYISRGSSSGERDVLFIENPEGFGLIQFENGTDSVEEEFFKHMAELVELDSPMNATDGHDDIDGRDYSPNNENILLGYLKSGFDTYIGRDDSTDIIYGGSGSDRLEGLGGDDKLIGQDGNDIIKGGDGNDELFGGEGDDTLEGGAGTDYISGGIIGSLEEADTIRFPVYSAYGIHINLEENTVYNDGYNFEDVILGIENVISGDRNDRIIGSWAANVIKPGYGSDYIDGGGGTDTVDYYTSDRGSPVVVDLSQNITLKGFNNSQTDVLLNIENVTGGQWGDEITGDDGDNILSGLGRNDTLYGKGGNDILNGGHGLDHVDGGDGIDTAVYEVPYSNGNTIQIDLSVGIVYNDGYGNQEMIFNIENILASDEDDEIQGDKLDNKLVGNRGDDILNGLGGNDEIEGSEDDDTIDGGEGDDILTGGRGTDFVSGGSGNDTFIDVFGYSDPPDRYSDTIGFDKIIFDEKKIEDFTFNREDSHLRIDVRGRARVIVQDFYLGKVIELLELSAGTTFDLTSLIEPDMVPAIPQNIQASDGRHEDRIEVSWEASQNAVRYELYRADADDFASAKLVASLSETSYADTQVVKENVYYYWVFSQSVLGVSSLLSESADGYAGKNMLVSADEYFPGLKQNDGNDWYEHESLGWLNTKRFPWVYHRTLGWLYAAGEGVSNFWLWNPELQWFWTTNDHYPYLYQNEPSRWLYYDMGSQNPQHYYHLSDQEWLSLQ